MSDDYTNASDNLAEAIGMAQEKSTGYHYDLEGLTVDQRLKVAEIQALLAIAQELSAINPQNTSRKSEDGRQFDGWNNLIQP